MRAALIDLVDDDETVESVGAAIDAESAILIAVDQCPDVAVLNMPMQGGGVHATREIRRLCPTTAVIALSSSSDRQTVGAMVEAGAACFLVKGASESDLLATISALVSGC